MKKYDLVIASDPAGLIRTTNEAIDAGYVPRGGMVHADGMYMQSIYLRPKRTKNGTGNRTAKKG